MGINGISGRIPEDDLKDTPLIDVIDLEFRYFDDADKVLIHNLSFQVNHGALFGIFGPSGVGKSTVMDILLGILEPTSGTVHISGVKPIDLLREHPGIIGYVPQNVSLFNKSLRQNVAFGLDKREVSDERVLEVLDLCGLSYLLDGNPELLNTMMGNNARSLSGGELQRIGIARALYRKPKYLFLDEPTSALDNETKEAIYKFLFEQKGLLTTVVISHDQGFQSLCDSFVQIG